MNSTLYQNAKAWPFEEARKLLKHLEDKKKPEEAVVTFETGYGPSGLPHLGTFGEVARTTMVRHAFSCLSQRKTQLICFSDDLDGFRKVPLNVPNREEMALYLEHPLTKVPDPFDSSKTFGGANNERLRAFLDSFHFEYTFYSATKCYQSGLFDDALLEVLKKHEPILKVILPTLGQERQATYSPFLPLSPSSGKILQVKMQSYNIDQGTVSFIDENQKLTEVSVTKGHCKLQWKVDWGMRWFALDVDYEMSGKDLIDSVALSSKICQILGRKPPIGLTCEHFLDEEGRKISKSIGNGLTIEEWLTYAPQESLAYFMYLTPWRAKRLSFDVIPKCIDEYLQHLEKYPLQTDAEKLENPVWHIHQGHPVLHDVPVNFSLLLNLVSVCKAETKEALWKFLQRYKDNISPEKNLFLDALIGYAVRYFHDFVKPLQKFRPPVGLEKEALSALKEKISLSKDDPVDLQQAVYEVGKIYFTDLKTWFLTLYQIFLGQDQGPRMGSFIYIYGKHNMIALIDDALA